MVPYELHLFSCTNDFACLFDGPAKEIRAFFKEQIRGAGLSDRVRANASGCLDQCGHGPMLVVYPQGVWYGHLGLEDARRIWHEHILGGRPVEELRYVPPRRGKNKLPRTPADSEARTRVDRASPSYLPCRRCPSQ
jgi:(2Fe-2S) ferredoxin